MTFELRVGPPPYINFDEWSDEDELSLTHYVGRDIDLGLTYFAEVSFSPHYPECREFSFCIFSRDAARNVAGRWFSGLGSAEVLTSREDRQIILDVVASGVCTLLQREHPLNVYRATHDRHAPASAMRKHQRIASVFEEHGYKVWPCDEWNGQRVWFATLLSEQDYRAWLAQMRSDDCD